MLRAPHLDAESSGRPPGPRQLGRSSEESNPNSAPHLPQLKNKNSKKKKKAEAQQQSTPHIKPQ